MASSNGIIPGVEHESTLFSDAIEDATEWGAKKVGSAALFLGTGAYHGAKFIGKKVGNAAIDASIGITKNTAKGSGRAARGIFNSLNKPIGLENPIGTILKQSYKGLGKMVDYSPKRVVYNSTRDKYVTKEAGFHFSKVGKGVFMGLTALSGASAAVSKFQESRMGNVDATPTRATPEMEVQDQSSNSPIDFGGATGDLVFALHANR